MAVSDSWVRQTVEKVMATTTAFHNTMNHVDKTLQELNVADNVNDSETEDDEVAESAAENSDQWETDLECSDDEKSIKKPKQSFDVTGKTNYKRACRALGVIPASSVLKNIHKSEINLAHHGLGPKGAAALGRGLARSTTVEKVNLRENGLLEEGTEQFAGMLLENCFITDLNLAGNRIGHRGAQAIGTVLQYNRYLVRLDLSNNDLTDKDASLIAEGLKENTTLKHLCLSHNAFCEDGGEALGAALAENCNLVFVDLSWNHLRLKGATAVSKAMGENSSITSLDLSWNGFADEEAAFMGKALKLNDTLMELDLSHNRITEKGARSLSKGLETNTALTLLKIGLNPIRNEGAFALLTAIQRNPDSAVKEIQIEGVSVRSNFVRQLEDYLKLHPNFKVLFEVFSETPRRQNALNGQTHVSDGLSSRELAIGRLGTKNELLSTVKDFLIKKRLRALDLFNSLDRDKTQSISVEEVLNGFKKLKVPLNDSQLKRLARLLDKDGSGEIHYSEFVAVNE